VQIVLISSEGSKWNLQIHNSLLISLKNSKILFRNIVRNSFVSIPSKMQTNNRNIVEKVIPSFSRTNPPHLSGKKDQRKT